MLIRHIYIQNWKNFREADFPIGERLFIIGPNASGKSNLLDVFRFLRDVAKDGLRSAVSKRGSISSIRCLAPSRNSDIEIKVEVEGDQKELWTYDLAISQDNNRNPIVKHEIIRRNGKPPLIERPDKDDKDDEARLRQTALEQYALNRDFRDLAEFLGTISYQHIIPQAVRDPAGFSSVPVSDDPYGRDFITRIWTSQYRDNRLKKIADVLKCVTPQLEYLEAKQDKTGRPHLIAGWRNWRKDASGQREDQLSDGTLRFLGLLWSCLTGDGPLLLEEPELSLHTEIVRRIPELFYRINVSRKKTRQYIISTHSEALLHDKSIKAAEIIRLEPSLHVTRIIATSAEDAKLMLGGRLSAADVLLPKTKPKSAEQLTFVFE